MYFIFVTSSTSSGVGKGMVATSLGLILQSYGYTVTFLKAESFLNLNPGKLEPSEQGETFVLSDGSEVGLDLGNYQRFCNLVLNKYNYLTAGSILYELINNEMNGEYNGKTLRYCTEFNNQVAQRLDFLASNPVCSIENGEKVFKMPDVIVIELEEPVADEDSHSFLKAFSSYFSKIDNDKKCVISVNFAYEIQKKIEENSRLDFLDNLKSYGFENDICVFRGCLTQTEINQVSHETGLPQKNLIRLKNRRFIYSIPESLYEEGLYEALKIKLNLPEKNQVFNIRDRFFKLNKTYGKIKTIGILTRYDLKDDPYISLEESLVIIGKNLEFDIQIKYINYQDLANADIEAYNSLKTVDGILIPGGFGNKNVDTKVMVAEYARTNNIPCLGICLGFQVMVIEYSRNVLGLKDATSEEFNEQSANLVIRRHPEIVCKNTKNDIFLGEYNVNFTGILADRIYKAESHIEVFRHRYSLNPNYEELLESKGMKFDGKTEDGRGVAFVLPGNSFYAGVQYHPELYSIPGNIDPIIKAYVESVIYSTK